MTQFLRLKLFFILFFQKRFLIPDSIATIQRLTLQKKKKKNQSARNEKKNELFLTYLNLPPRP